MIEKKPNFSDEIHYPENVKKYDLSKPPVKQTKNVVRLTHLFSGVLLSLLRKGHKLNKINMDGLKPPYILLSNHMQWMDFSVLLKDDCLQ